MLTTNMNKARELKAAEVRSVGAEKLKALGSPYKETERETWSIQFDEASAFLADSSHPTPMIDSIATYRGITKAELVTLIMENANLFRGASGSILGIQQALLSAVYSAVTPEELQNITWPQE